MPMESEGAGNGGAMRRAKFGRKKGAARVGSRLFSAVKLEGSLKLAGVIFQGDGEFF